MGKVERQRIDRVMAMRTDITWTHGGLLEYCDYIQPSKVRKNLEWLGWQIPVRFNPNGRRCVSLRNLPENLLTKTDG
jgi:hypothetical protein